MLLPNALSKSKTHDLPMRKRHSDVANLAIHSSLPPEAFFTANAVVDPETGAALEYRHLRVGPDAKEWLQGASNEIGVSPRVSNPT